MDRTAALARLTQIYRELATDAEFTSQQTTDAYGEAIDMSLRYLGFDESELASATVKQSDLLKYLALAEYFALERFSTLHAIRYDVGLPGPVNVKRSQAFDRITVLLSRAEQKLSSLGIEIGGNGDSMQVGSFNLDFLEPSNAGGEF